jgi:hypothetical protein
MYRTRHSIRAILAQLNTALIPITQTVISLKQRQQQSGLNAKPLTASEQLTLSPLYKQDKE